MEEDNGNKGADQGQTKTESRMLSHGINQASKAVEREKEDAAADYPIAEQGIQVDAVGMDGWFSPRVLVPDLQVGQGALAKEIVMAERSQGCLPDMDPVPQGPR